MILNLVRAYVVVTTICLALLVTLHVLPWWALAILFAAAITPPVALGLAQAATRADDLAETAYADLRQAGR